MRFLSEDKIEASPDFNWDDFLKEARLERVTPLLYRKFCAAKTSNNLFPFRIQELLKSDYYTQLINNNEILRQFEELGSAFNNEKIPFILFKGLALAVPIYQDLGVRPSHDIDILIKDTDIFKASSILNKFGYQAPFSITTASKFKVNRYRNALLYTNPEKDKIPIHLFWHLLNLVPYHKKVFLDMAKIWQGAIRTKLGNLHIYTLNFNHQIIYLSMHAMSHGFFPLILLADIKELIARQEEARKIDWEALLIESFSFGLSKQVYYCLFAAVKLTGARVPAEVLEKLKPEKISSFEQEFIKAVLNRSCSPGQEFLAYLGMNESLLDKIKFLAAAFFPAKNELALIRQKDVLEVNSLDYLSRFVCGLKCALKPLPRNNLSKKN